MARNGRNSATFTDDEGWSEVEGHFSLEPAMAVGSGMFALDKGREMFASIGDSAPDSWGRRLMRRMERRAALGAGPLPPLSATPAGGGAPRRMR